MKFKCPQCDSTRIEEVLTAVTQTTEIKEVIIDEETFESVEYGEATFDGGEVEKFQCLKCGFHIAENSDELTEFSIDNDMV